MVHETLRLPKSHKVHGTLRVPTSHVVHETPRLPKSHMVDGILPYVGLFMLVRRSVRGRIH